MDRLPNEILSEIFGELGYFDLKLRIPLVCKRFHTILVKSGTGATKVDKALFRDVPPKSKTAYGSDPKTGFKKHTRGPYKSHPIFSLIDYRFDYLKGVSEIRVLRDPEGGVATASVFDQGAETVSFIKHPARDENAISPALKHITIDNFPYDEDVFGTGAGGAVTVHDVMVRSVKYITHRQKFAGGIIGKSLVDLGLEDSAIWGDGVSVLRPELTDEKLDVPFVPKNFFGDIS